MPKVSISIPCLDVSEAESDEANMYNLLKAVASSLTDPEMRQRLELVIQTYSLRAASGAATKDASHNVLAAPIFAGGRAYEFGPFRLFPSQRLLLEGDKKVDIGSRAFDILTALVERAGEIVGKHELVAHVWPNVFVHDSNLKTQISGLRRTLGEGRTGRRYIVTVSGRGYNFVAPVTLVRETTPDAPDLTQRYSHDGRNGSGQRHETAQVPRHLN